MNASLLPFRIGRIGTSRARVSPGAWPGVLRIRFASGARQPGIRIPAPAGGWNLEGFTAIDVDVFNSGTREAAILCRAGPHSWNDGIAVVAPGATGTVRVLLKRRAWPPPLRNRFPGINGAPGDFVWIWDAPDGPRVTELGIHAITEAVPESIEVSRIRAVPVHATPEPDPMSRAIFPLVDGYGQYRHRDWPGKTHSDRDLAAVRRTEDADLRRNRGPAGRTRWGGWAAGPRLAATGHFRTHKVRGRWWLVDPGGALFWSHGITCVNARELTPLEGRERFFGRLPRREALAAFRHREAFDYCGANLRRKFGSRWLEESRGRAHRRLRSWGMNTIANWSDPAICAMGRTPYCATVRYSGRRDRHSFPDMADPACRGALRAGCRELGARSAHDPWCIGWFIDNELNWPRVPDLARLADTYYRVCRDEMKAVAPHKLYLGSRVHMHDWPFAGEPEVVRAAARWCDVVSFNRYRFTAADLRLLPGDDKPILVGEWHFGALDRGMLHTGLRSVGSQAERGRAYSFYLRGALANPAVVGAHWFQYHDQCTTGRFDGENYQIGFLDICDTPYPETIAASRSAGFPLYRARLNS